MKKILKLSSIIVVGLLLFYGVLLVFGSDIAGLLYQALFYGKYNTMFISELALLLFSLVILLVRRKIGILRPQGKKFWYSVKRGMPILVIATIVLIGNATGLLGEGIDIPNLVSLIALAATIGMAEEFFFRGFIQKEITDKYSNNRKEVIISIVISGVIFGIVHLTNALSGQDILTTFMQVLQASSLGILLGSVYFITNNIWSVVFLHAFYDFAIMLGEVNSFKDCMNSTDVSFVMLLFTVGISLVYVIIYLVGAYLNLQRRYVNEYVKEEVTEDIIFQDKEKATTAKKLIVVVVVLLFLASPLIPADEALNSQICYNYESVKISGEITYSLDKKYQIENYKLYIDNYNLVIENDNDGSKQQVDLDDNIYDLYVIDKSGNYEIILNASEVVYLGVISTSDSLGKLENNLQRYDVPEIVTIGKIQNGEEIYPVLKSYISDYFIIKDNKVMVIE